ncbi:Hypothetical predicted protein [Paramuricea clavata]|uniref:Uncharacterized protein n=1 Tax=Paramuricea clavata TaxID=317549 RepID=A0A6S7FVS4_PARCT|nr:Hypothetical predicted protein [Paramuricea clavata]
MADSRKRGRSDDKVKNNRSPKKSARISSWKDEEVLALLSIMKEETILYNLDNDKTPKEKRSAYRHVAAKMEQKALLGDYDGCLRLQGISKLQFNTNDTQTLHTYIDLNTNLVSFLKLKTSLKFNVTAHWAIPISIRTLR